jgi:hypothetical protein
MGSQRALTLVHVFAAGSVCPIVCEPQTCSIIARDHMGLSSSAQQRLRQKSISWKRQAAKYARRHAYMYVAVQRSRHYCCQYQPSHPDFTVDQLKRERLSLIVSGFLNFGCRGEARPRCPSCASSVAMRAGPPGARI